MKDFKNFKSYKKPKKNYSLIKRKIILIIISAVLVVVFIYAAFKGLYFLKNAQESKIKYIYIKGNSIIDSKYLIKSLKINKDTKLNNQLKIDVYNELMKNPYIAQANVATIKPDTLYIDIKEKKPLCILEANNRKLMFSSNGQYMTDDVNSQQINTNKILHIKMSNLTTQINNKSAVLGLIKLYKKLDKLEKISYISMEDNKFEVYFENGIMVKANMFDCDYDKSAARLETIWQKLLPDVKKIESVSICYPDRIIIKWKTKEINSGR
ncbi:MAG: cell division protein FtsQ/DivIB [Desulfurella sp.]